MLNNLKAIIFDLDQTLVDSIESIIKIHELSGKDYGIEITKDKIMKHYGKPMSEFIENVYEKVAPTKKILENLSKYAENFPFNSFPGGPEVISNLNKNYSLGILTSSTSYLANKNMTKAGYDPKLFDFVYGSDNTKFHKPDPRVFDLVIENLNKSGINHEEMLYVGDSTDDYISASEAGLNFIGVLSGMKTIEDFVKLGHQENFIIEDITKLKNLI